ncbi:MAG TPA: PIN domain-containing protein [Thermoanaerobaculia bacterium]
MRRRFLLDLNVVLDVLLERRPHVASAAALWAAIERGLADGLLPAHALTTIHYLAGRARGARFARQTVGDLLDVFPIAPVDQKVLRHALGLPLKDFEDAVCAACATVAKCDAIVTRDPTGFRGSSIPAIDPATAVALLAGPGTE